MKYRRFGRTELNMAVISCGGMRYQQAWKDIPLSEVPKENQQNLEATIHRALEVGINHIETARGYGSSEMQLGLVLSKIPRDKYILQTKIAPYADPKKFLETFEVSMKYLKTDYVDLLSLHGINTHELLDFSVRKNGCLDAAKKLQKEGRVRHIGFSTHAPTQIIVDTVRTNEFSYMNLHWYYINQCTWPAIEEAAKLDMGVFIISPNDKGGMLYHPSAKMLELCHPLSPMAFNDLFCLRRKEVHTLSCGASRPTDFDEHIKALDHYDNIDSVLKPIESRIQAQLEATHGKEWCEFWHEYIPDYFDFPNEVNVFDILRIYTYGSALELSEWAKSRYNMIGNSGHWVPGQQSDKYDHRASMKLIQKNRFAAKIPDILKKTHELFHEKPGQRLSST